MKSITNQLEGIEFLTALYDAGIRLGLCKNFFTPLLNQVSLVRAGDPLYVRAYKTNSHEAVYVIPYGAYSAPHSCSIMPARMSEDLRFDFNTGQQRLGGELIALEPRQDHQLGLRGSAVVRRNGKEQKEYSLYERWNPEIFSGIETQPINLVDFMMQSYLPNLGKRSPVQE